MEERLQHDPRTKMQIKELLYSFLYEPVQKQFQIRLNQLIERNTIQSGVGHRSFIYKGQFYSMETTPPPRKVTRLLPELQPDMDTYLAELKTLNEKEMPYVVGFITQVLNSSNDLHDYLRVFPEVLHRPIQKIIDSCPCRTKRLSEEEVNELKKMNKNSIDMLKQRMVINLLI